ncbi:MAG: VOC family protein [Lachnospiraceae bacterium]
MSLKNILIAVSDIQRSKRFYHDVFGLNVVSDFGENVILSEGLVLQEQKTWERLVGTNIVAGNASELFFEESDFDGLLLSLEKNADAREIGEVRVNSWGKRSVMLQDPDGHLIEAAER